MTNHVLFTLSFVASSFFSIISRIQFKTPLPTVQLQLPLSQPSLHSDVLFIPGAQGYQGFLSLELNSNLEIVTCLMVLKILCYTRACHRDVIVLYPSSTGFTVFLPTHQNIKIAAMTPTRDNPTT